MKTALRLSVAVILGVAFSLQAQVNFVGGNGGISYGVSPYAGPAPGFPTYILNNFTGVKDILTSPGGTYLRANPVIANNILSTGPGLLATPLWAFQIGGGNVNGGFGAATATIVGPTINYAITDSGPAGGSASYGIASWTSDYTVGGAGYVGTYGNWISVAGSLPLIGSAGVVALKTSIESANPASPFFGGIDLPALVLADARVGANTYSWVALGGTGAAILTDGVNATFRGLAVNNNNIALPAGDAFTVTSTLTFYADPAQINELDTPDAELLAAVGTGLPNLSTVSTVPEPGTWVVMGAGLLWLVVLRRRR